MLRLRPVERGGKLWPVGQHQWRGICIARLRAARTNPARACDALPAHRPQAGRLAAQEERKERDALDGMFVFMDEDKREFFQTQRERIYACRRVDTTEGMRLIQTTRGPSTTLGHPPG